MDDKTIVLDDSLKSTDNFTQRKNSFTIFAKDGEEVFRGYNVVVDMGRLLNLQNIFKLNVDNSLSLHETPKLYVSAFSIGDGAATLEALSTPVLPSVTDETLFNKVPFYAGDLTRVYEEADDKKPRYWSNTDFKDFTSILFKHDIGSTEMYAEITLRIGMSEALGKNINEVGLYMAEHIVDNTGVVTGKTNFKLFSKFTFASLPKSEYPNRDEYTIVYKVYV